MLQASTIWLVALSAGAVNSGLLSPLFLFVERGKRQANVVMSLLLLILALITGNMLTFLTGIMSTWPHLSLLVYPLWFLIGPLYYAYFRALTRRVTWPGPGYFILHSFPFLTIVFLLLPYYILDSSQKLAILNGQMTNPAAWVFPFALGIYLLQTLVYIWIVKKEITAYSARYRETEAGDHLYLIQWLQFLLKALLFYFIVDALLNGFQYWQGVYIPWINYTSILLLSGLTYSIAAVAMLRPQSLFPRLPVATDRTYRRSSLGAPEINALAEDLRQRMKTEKPHLDPDLSLQKLAEQSGILPHQLSQVLSQGLGTNFHNLINEARIVEAKAYLSSAKYAHYSIEAIAAAAGFKSRSSFYRLFKTHTGMTPAAFAKSQPSKKAAQSK